MTLLDLAPWAGLVGAAGVALLILSREAAARIAGAALLIAGSVPLALTRVDDVGDAVEGRALLIAAAVVVGGAAYAVAVAAAVRRPWIVPLAALVLGLRIPMSASPSPTDHLAPFWIVVAVGLGALVWRSIRGTQPPPRLGLVGYALAAYVGLAALSLFWTLDEERGAYVLVAFYLPLGALAAMVGSLELTRRLRELLVAAQLALAGVFALVAIYQWGAHDIFWNPTVIDANNYTPFYRANSLFWDPAAFGRFQALALITLVGVVGLARSRRALIGAGAIGALVFAGLVLSYSRSALVMLIAGLIALAAVWRPRTTARTGAVAAGAVLVLLGGLAVAGTADSNIENITSDRSSLAEQGADEYFDRPLAGVGLGSFGLAADRPEALLGPHNVVLGVAAELGTLGLLALAALIAAVGFAVFRPARPDRDRALRTVLAVEVFAIFVQSLIDAGLFDDPFTWVMVALLAVCAAPDREAAAHA